MRAIWNDLPTVDRHHYFERTTTFLKDYNELVEVGFVTLTFRLLSIEI